VKYAYVWLAAALCLIPVNSGPARPADPGPRTEPHRSPADVAVLPGGRLALSANQTADSASLVDLQSGKVLDEKPCGHKPAAVACSADGTRAAVSNLWSGTLTLLEVRGETLRTSGEVRVGHLPRGIEFAPGGGRLYVALSGAGEVAEVDWPTRTVVRRLPAAGEPRRLALTADGRYLAATSGRSAQVRCWDARAGKLLWERTVHDAFNLHGLTLSPDGKSLVTTLVHDHHHTIAKNMIENSWALDSRLARLAMGPDGARGEFDQIAVDQRGRAVGDPCAVAFSEKGDWLAAAAAGTQELLVFRAAAAPWAGSEPPDFLDSSLAVDEGKFRRVPLGGRPLAVQFAVHQAVVANYLLDCLQVVDVAAAKVVRTVPLGGPATPSLARRGEAIFYDAKRSHHQWFSCHTCHPDGHTSGQVFDTLNDESYGNPKLTPSLRGVARTGPYTWHGWQKDLGAAVEKSMTETLFGPKPSADDVKAVVAFLGTLDHPPNPHRGPGPALSAAAGRGESLFRGKAGCVRCHKGADYTSPKTYDVKLESDGSPYDEWNPPSLRGLCDRGPYLHDGRADTLEEVLRGAHAPEKLGGEELTPAERRDLVEFLKSL
jgi:cytochrome c peroxidase